MSRLLAAVPDQMNRLTEGSLIKNRAVEPVSSRMDGLA